MSDSENEFEEHDGSDGNSGTAGSVEKGKRKSASLVEPSPEKEKQGAKTPEPGDASPPDDPS